MNHPKPRLIHPLPDPLGLYIRPASVDHRALLALLAEGRSAVTGIVFEPSWAKRDRDTLKKLENERQKLGRWRETLGHLARHQPATTFSTVPETRASRRPSP